jgi:endoglucanase
MKTRLFLALAACLAGIAGAGPARATVPAPLHADGNTLRDPANRVVRLQGVNVPSMEWSNAGDKELLRSVEEAFDGWGANLIRLPLAQDRWFGKAQYQSDSGAEYRQIVHDVVAMAAERGDYVLLDLHWSDAGVWGKEIGQHNMPDSNSLLFWQSVAPEFKNHPAVLFDLYNEPHDVSWEVWKNGGRVIEKAKDGTPIPYATPGMQKLLDAVRATGAKNPVVAGGLDWAYDLTGMVKGFALSDPQAKNVVYSTHIYPWKSDWEGHIGAAADRYQVLVGEVGCEPDPKHEDPATWAPKILAFIDKRRLNWTAWCFHPSATPRLLANYEYAPTPYWGEPVKKALKAAAAVRATLR